MMSTFLLLLIFVGFSSAQVTDKPLVNPSDSPNLTAWVIVGVMATTTLLVLIIMISTIVYYKFLSRKDNLILKE